MSEHTQDDGFHEIQLNGKQLVFLFMAATVVSVVIFLCGVLVGRGVRADRGGSASEAAAPLPVSGSEIASATPKGTVVPPPSGSDPTAAAPPPTVDELSYFNRLETQNQPAEDLKPAAKPVVAPPVAAPAPASAPVSAKVVTAPKPTPSKAAVPEAAAQAPAGFTVQIAALNVRNEADAIASRLSSKGYAAYVVPPGNGALMYRVRVGRFKTRREAEPTASKLEREEQFKPWITR